MTNNIMKTSEVASFNYENLCIRTVKDEQGEPWFVANDICAYFGVTNRNRVLQRLDADERGVRELYTPGGWQRMSVINESGLYSLLFSLAPREARGIPLEEIEAKYQKIKQFKRWVTHEVLPAIRKHGGYITTQKMEELLQDPDSLIKMLEAIKAERAKNKALTARIEADKPKTVFADAVAASTQCILVGDLAKTLKQNGVKTGQNRLFAWLRENGYLHKTGSRKNMPTQRAMEMGLFEVKETAITHSDGHVSISFTTKVTGKGQQYFINKFLDEKRA